MIIDVTLIVIYLLISLIRDFILSNDGLHPPDWSMSSMGTELNTIEVITL